MKYPVKVTLNAAVLGLGYFASLWASVDYLGYAQFKALALFIIMYLVTDLTAHYHINKSVPRSSKARNTTLIF